MTQCYFPDEVTSAVTFHVSSTLKRHHEGYLPLVLVSKGCASLLQV